MKRALILAILLFLAATWLIPIYVMFSASLKSLSEIGAGNYLSLPSKPEVGNWKTAFETLKNALKNSLIVSIPATVITVFIGSWTGYAVAMFKFPGKDKLFFIIAIVTFLPYQIFLIPLTRLVVSLGLFNTFPGMITAYVILNTPMAILITSLFFQTIPKEIYEAASLDGCGAVGFYFKILLPISLAGITSAAVLTFTNVWNEFIIALSLSRDPTTRLAIPTLAGLKGSYVAQWNVLMAGAAIVSIPGILILIFLGRFFIKGLTAGAVKE